MTTPTQKAIWSYLIFFVWACSCSWWNFVRIQLLLNVLFTWASYNPTSRGKKRVLRLLEKLNYQFDGSVNGTILGTTQDTLFMNVTKLNFLLCRNGSRNWRKNFCYIHVNQLFFLSSKWYEISNHVCKISIFLFLTEMTLSC